MHQCHVLILTVWAAWCLYWLGGAFFVKRTARREPFLSRLSHIVPVACGVWLIFAPLGWTGSWGEPRLVPTLPRCVGALVLVALGLLFTLWARWHLGRNWSASVTAKRDHELVRSGPYAWVRHPIYSGLLLALMGDALDVGAPHALLGLLIVFAGFTHKLRIEERVMRQLFGAAYTDYRSAVPALVPLRAARRSAPR
ncbi:MAG: isoprenylcysteine carboxylmethyltransferase family protein [Gammaproteobacteria bacterium]|nr:isoprenylcysteine carboxylmethyltransferase family protein [Gammaproteobacteria bacterium]MBV9620860.1 isoprenylcysteine carboxylmethyltransferase family protein [Gammaproteobacteria bacterium]